MDRELELARVLHELVDDESAGFAEQGIDRVWSCQYCGDVDRLQTQADGTLKYVPSHDYRCPISKARRLLDMEKFG